MSKSDTTVSKFLSLILRHNPGEIGLGLDDNGWAKIDEIIEKAGFPLTRARIDHIVATNDKKRFIISDDGARIRANQGHSLNVDLELEAIEPPQHVHLSADVDTASKVGVRHGKLVILTIPALDMHKAGHTFYQAKNGVWLTDHVPGRALKLLK